MSTKFPEHIDQIEEFYQQELGQLSLEPSAQLWGKIREALPSAQKPVSFWSRTSVRWLAGTAGAIAIALVLWFTLPSSKDNGVNSKLDTPKVQPTLKTPQTTPEVNQIKDSRLDPKVPAVGLTRSGRPIDRNVQPAIVPQTPANLPVNADAVSTQENTSSPNVETQTPAATPEQTQTATQNNEPKKPASFFETQRELNKGNTREIFDPMDK